MRQKRRESSEECKYVVADVHCTTTSFLVRDENWNFLSEATVVTETEALRSFVKNLGRRVHIAFEEGTQAAWLYDLWKPLAEDVLVCDPRRNHLLADGNKSDPIDLQKLSELQKNGSLRRVYHGHQTTRTLKELTVAYRNLVRESTRAKNRLKAVFRSLGISTTGEKIYDYEEREQWLEQIAQPGLRQRAAWLYEQICSTEKLRDEALQAVVKECRKHAAVQRLRSVPGIGPVRAAEIVGIVDTPFRFRTKRQIWAYAGLAVVTRSSADFDPSSGKNVRRNRAPITRGLNRNHNPHMKNVFKGAALDAARGEFKEYYENLLARGLREELARVTLARKIAAIVLHVWKKGENFDPARIRNSSGDMTRS